MMSRRILLVSFLMLVLGFAAISPLMGQDETILTITAPGWVSHVFSHELFAPFEAEHPGVKVVPVEPGDGYYYPSAGEDIQQHLDGAQKYVSTADVVYVDRHIASVEATRAGYFLNLAPFIASDPTFDANDFFPRILQSAQWDDGTWYIPASAYVEMMIYDTKAFDAAGLPYPNERWTFEDFARAARDLTEYDQAGKVVVPGFQLYNPALFYYGFTGQTFYDASVSPSAPKFDSPDLIAFYEQWKELEQDISAEGNYDYTKVAFQTGAPWRIPAGSAGSDRDWQSSLLPGGVTSLSIEGFGVSGGTPNPELAFALANFVSSDPQVLAAFGGDTPARRNLLEANADPSTDVQGIEQALENAVPISELRFQDYLDAAVDQAANSDNPVDMNTAIQQAQANAVNGLETASARRDTSTVYVVTPVPTPMMSADQIVIHFGLGLDPTANQSEWTQLVNEFLAANPTVGNVEFDTDFFEESELAKLDCLYLPYNQVPTMQLDKFLSFDPLMAADPSFDHNDFIVTVLDQVQRDNQVWAYPMIIQPSVMWYDAELFDKAGLPSPEQGWTADDFNNALQSLRGSLANDTDPVFESGTYGNTYLLMLIATFGGLPYDYRTSPPTLNLTDPATVEAVRQVLDLAKAGYISYQGLAENKVAYIGAAESPITDDVFSNSSYRLMNRSNPDGQDTFRLANFPQGSQYTPVAYEVGASYIQTQAQNPDACYQWITALAKRPDLLGGMPARVSQVNDASINAAQGEDISALYQSFMALFQQSNTVAFPSQYGSSDFNAYLEPMWLNRAFDHYVLEDADLETELADAQSFIEGYRACTSGITEVNAQDLTTQEESTAYYRQFADCAIQVDPSMQDTLSYLY